MIAASYEIVLWWWILDARPPLWVLSIFWAWSFLHTEYLCLSRISCLFELIWCHDNRLVWGWSLTDASSWACKLWALSKCRSAVLTRLVDLSATGDSDLWISLRKELLLMSQSSWHLWCIYIHYVFLHRVLALAHIIVRTACLLLEVVSLAGLHWLGAT